MKRKFTQCWSRHKGNIKLEIQVMSRNKHKKVAGFLNANTSHCCCLKNKYICTHSYLTYICCIVQSHYRKSLQTLIITVTYLETHTCECVFHTAITQSYVNHCSMDHRIHHKVYIASQVHCTKIPNKNCFAQ